MASEESEAHPAYIDALLRAESEDTVITEAFSVMWPHAPHRVLRSCIDEAESHPEAIVGQMRLGEETLPVPRFAVPTPTRDTTGKVAAMALYAGESVAAVCAVVPAGEIVRELAEGAEALLAQAFLAASGRRL